MKKRFLSILLALCMATQFVPTAALAAQSDAVGNGTATALVDAATEQGSDQGAGDGDNETALYNEAAINAVDETGDDAGELVVASMNGTHSHKVCVETNCTENHADLPWTEWTDTANLPNTPGNYYLANNVTLTDTWTCNADINLCLNGHTIYGANERGVIWVEKGELDITDCHSVDAAGKITHKYGDTGCGVSNDNTFTLWNGSITGNSTYDGGGVINFGTFAMRGGSIDGNASHIHGGGVYEPKGTFTMTGGSIDNNTATDGGGVCINGTFTMTGGSIERNTAGSDGGGVLNGGTFTMSGGSIAGNSAYHGGGVANSASFTMSGGSIAGNEAKEYGGGVNNWGAVNLSGNVTIKGNTANGADNNVYVGYDSWYSRVFGVSVAGAIGDGASVGITSSDPGDTTVVNGSTDTEVFFSDDETYTLTENSDNSGLKLTPLPHEHCICGDTDCENTEHDRGITWTKWTSTDSLPTDPGNYYLNTNVTLSSTWECGADVKLCLNGKTITETGDADVIKVNGKTLAITDCHDGEEVGRLPTRRTRWVAVSTTGVT